MYIRRLNSVQMPFSFHTYLGKAEERALIDSGATDNFIDYKTVARLRLGSKKLRQPRPVRNVDGSPNKAGTISRYCDLVVQKGQQKERIRFFVTNLGRDRLILGYPWLAKFNPQIDWPSASVKGPRVVISTIAARIKEGLKKPLTPKEEEVNKVTFAQQMALKAHNPDKVLTLETLPEEFKRYTKVFSEEEAKKFPPSRPWDHRIKLKENAPDCINGKVYPLPPAHTKALDEWIDQNLDKGYISVSDSKYGSPTFVVPKKDGGYRIVQDYRELNQHTETDVTPLPNMATAIQDLADCTLFSKFDIRDGYYNIQVVPEDRWKTGFNTHRGHYEFNVMPQGLKGAPPTFARNISEDLQPLYRKHTAKRLRHYMDDVIFGTRPGEKSLHVEMVHDFLKWCEDNHYHLKPSKCEFMKPEIDFLGMHLGNGQVTIDPAKVTGIRDWPRTLRNVKEVRSTLGVLGFQRPFIPNFAKIAKPLTDLLKKDSTFCWTENCSQALDTLINIVTSEPILVPPDLNEQFFLEVDASQYATGAILYQADKERKDRRGNPILRPCGYHSQTFSATEQRYPIYDREYLAVMRGLRHWDYLLLGTQKPVIVITDHANLEYYRHPRKIGPRVSGYIAEREKYNIKLMYRPGKTNRADALSRRPDYAPDPYNDDPVIALPTELFIPLNTPTITLQTELRKPTRIRTLILGDPAGQESTLEIEEDPFGEAAAEILNAELDEVTASEIEAEVMKNQKEHQDTLERWKRAHNVEHRPGDLWWKDEALVVVGNNDLKKGVISLFHDPYTAGHPGIAKTTTLCSKYYWWPGMRDSVTQYIKGCATCQMNKVNTNPNRPALFPITPEPNALPFETIALDFITKLPNSEGYDTILTITDHDCTKASIFLPCNETIDSPEVVKLYATHVFPHYGIPKKIISDRDPRFTSSFAQGICQFLGIKQNISTAYHPQTDGQSERTNQALEQFLRLYCTKRTWASLLPIAQYVHNSWTSSTTKKTPFDLLIGYTPQAHQPTRPTHLPNIETRLEYIKEARNAAQEALSKVQSQMAKGNNRFKPYQIGDQVWLEGTNLNLPYKSRKLSPRRFGPFKITSVISPVAYKLKLPDNWKIHNVFHASLLTPYSETEIHGSNFLEPPPDLLEGEPEWEVEEILGSRRHGRKKQLQFLVRWKGYSPAHDSWVDKSDLHAPNLLQDFLRRHPTAIRTIHTPDKEKDTLLTDWTPPTLPTPTSSSCSHQSTGGHIRTEPERTEGRNVVPRPPQTSLASPLTGLESTDNLEVVEATVNPFVTSTLLCTLLLASLACLVSTPSSWLPCGMPPPLKRVSGTSPNVQITPLSMASSPISQNSVSNVATSSCSTLTTRSSDSSAMHSRKMTSPDSASVCVWMVPLRAFQITGPLSKLSNTTGSWTSSLGSCSHTSAHDLPPRPSTTCAAKSTQTMDGDEHARRPSEACSRLGGSVLPYTLTPALANGSSDVTRTMPSSSCSFTQTSTDLSPSPKTVGKPTAIPTPPSSHMSSVKTPGPWTNLDAKSLDPMPSPPLGRVLSNPRGTLSCSERLSLLCGNNSLEGA